MNIHRTAAGGDRALRLAILLLAALALNACARSTPTPIPTLAVTPSTRTAGENAGGGIAGGNGGEAAGAVTASAEAVPARAAEFGFAAAGFVQTVDVQEGEPVQGGDRLASLANLDELQALVDAGQQSLESAQKALDSLTAGAPLALASAQLEVTQNQKRYDDAVKHLKRENVRRCSKDTLDLYQRRFDDAKERLKDAQEASDGSLGALERVREAQNVFDTAQANYIYCMGYTAQEIAESGAELAVAEAALQHSTERYTLLQKENGLDPDEAARLRAAVTAAQANLAAARSALDSAVVLAPFDGTLVRVGVVAGQAVTPGQPVFVLAQLSLLQIETTDLSERDIARVKVGQPAAVTVEALGETFAGDVVKIDPRASKIGGDVVYKVTIALAEPPSGLRWGMSAKVTIGP